jgi:hypothetical protein
MKNYLQLTFKSKGPVDTLGTLELEHQRSGGEETSKSGGNLNSLVVLCTILAEKMCLTHKPSPQTFNQVQPLLHAHHELTEAPLNDADAMTSTPLKSKSKTSQCINATTILTKTFHLPFSTRPQHPIDPRRHNARRNHPLYRTTILRLPPSSTVRHIGSSTRSIGRA